MREFSLRKNRRVSDKKRVCRYIPPVDGKSDDGNFKCPITIYISVYTLVRFSRKHSILSISRGYIVVALAAFSIQNRVIMRVCMTDIYEGERLGSRRCVSRYRPPSRNISPPLPIFMILLIYFPCSSSYIRAISIHT